MLYSSSQYPRLSSSTVVTFMSMIAFALILFAGTTPAVAMTTDGHPGDTEVVDISKAALSTTPSEKPAAASSVPMIRPRSSALSASDQVEQPLGETVTDSLGRGRGKRTRRLRARGRFSMGFSKKTAGSD